MPAHASFAGKPQRRDRLIRESVHDPYKVRVKLTEPGSWRHCQAVWRRGRWQWGGAPAGANKTPCATCPRSRDRVPADLLLRTGDFFKAHRAEILNFAQDHGEQQRREHPLKRLTGIAERPDGVEIAFTDTHRPRGVGETIESAFNGTLEIRYTDESNLVRVPWSR